MCGSPVFRQHPNCPQENDCVEAKQSQDRIVEKVSATVITHKTAVLSNS